jgi:hypothetical protein
MSQQITIVDCLEEANEAAHIKSFSFANIAEFNAFIESFNFSDFPANVVVPFTINGVFTNNRTKQVVPLQGWVLKRIDDDTVNVRTAKAERDHIQPMREKAISFLRAILDTDMIDPEVENVSYTVRAEYAFLNQRLFGVSYTMNVPVMENIC